MASRRPARRTALPQAAPTPRRWTRVLNALVRLTQAGTLLAFVVALAVLYIGWSTAGRQFADPARVPQTRVALVFGAGVGPDGSATPMLAARVLGAVELYRRGRVQKLLFSGDNSRVDYNEVAAMQDLAEAAGVPTADITLDYAGFSTYQSCYRARAIFGVEKAVLVTQGYHLPRALYTCAALGVDAVGLDLPDWGTYPHQFIAVYVAREVASSLKALWQVHVTRPLPTFLGPFEGID